MEGGEMIRCMICKKQLNESRFGDINRGGLPICFACEDTPEAQAEQAKSENGMREAKWDNYSQDYSDSEQVFDDDF
jgi:hypothetical protein